MHPKSPIRRTHSPEFKAQVLAACRQPGASVAAIALSHGLNTNVVRKWLAGLGLKRCGNSAVVDKVLPPTPLQFLPVGVPATNSGRSDEGSADIRLDLDLGTLRVKLHCARGAAPSHAAMLHALAEMVTRA